MIALTAGAGVGAQPAKATGSWHLLPKSPLTTSPFDLTAVWTGHEMIIHGYYFPPMGGIRGATIAYRPASNTWKRLANGPSRPSAYETHDFAVWTGSRMLVFGQSNGAFDPATNTWGPLPWPPMTLDGAVTAWTGHRFFAWGGGCCGGQSHDGYVYRTAKRTWTKLPTAPLSARLAASGTWTGKQLIVAGGVKAESSQYFKDAAAYDPATGKWRKIASMPRGEVAATSIWDGKEILMIGGEAQQHPLGRGLAYNPASNRWRQLPAMAYPRSGCAAVWTGRQVLVWGGLTTSKKAPPHGEAYTPATGKWTALPASPLRGRTSPVAVWTGRQLIVWGGGARLTDGAIYTPAR